MGIAEAICQRRTSLTSDVDFTSVVERQRQLKSIVAKYVY
jgi:hypothetical protein